MRFSPTTLFVIAALVLVFTASAFAQVFVPGEVVDVIDAKTVVVATSAGRVTLELQYIDVPPPEVPMHASIKKHLHDLVFGKQVQYRARTLSYDRTIGQLFSNDVDVSQQMLRDGAGWHVPAEISGQERTDFAGYASFELAAKQEKRGVWGDATLKPVWEGGAPPSQQADVTKAKLVAVPGGYWSDVNPRLGSVGALQHGYNAATKHGYVGIPLLGVSDPNAFAKEYRTGVDLTYFYTEGKKGRTGYFVMTVVSSAANWRFQDKNTLIGYTDGERFTISAPKRIARHDGDTYDEILTYRLNRSTVERLANANLVGVEAGDYTMVPHPWWQMVLNNLLEVSR